MSPFERFSKTGIAISLAFVADLSATAAVVTSSGLRALLKENYILLSITCGISFATILALLNHYPRKVALLTGELKKQRNIIEGPTTRDLDNFKAILDSLPWGGSFLSHLKFSFMGKNWRGHHFDHIREFLAEWREHFFDDSVVDQSFRKLWKSMDYLCEWMILEGEARDPESEDAHFRTVPLDNRPGGFREYDAVREKGEKLAWDVIEARREIERIGRKRRL